MLRLVCGNFTCGGLLVLGAGVAAATPAVGHRFENHSATAVPYGDEAGKRLQKAGDCSHH
ncbi:hypothetical protein [Noviherbaspirillum album]|uniref:hypothetical protein n=1 Tax=Noviherbaspirillum album TaxID=3080276 RepID=UPI002DD655F7|nr:hypothetical protein [Noviherbaspirillum sp. CPCC 100848]